MLVFLILRVALASATNAYESSMETVVPPEDEKHVAAVSRYHLAVIVPLQEVVKLSEPFLLLTTISCARIYY